MLCLFHVCTCTTTCGLSTYIWQPLHSVQAYLESSSLFLLPVGSTLTFVTWCFGWLFFQCLLTCTLSFWSEYFLIDMVLRVHFFHTWHLWVRSTLSFILCLSLQISCGSCTYDPIGFLHRQPEHTYFHSGFWHAVTLSCLHMHLWLSTYIWQPLHSVQASLESSSLFLLPVGKLWPVHLVSCFTLSTVFSHGLFPDGQSTFS
jgi:hypothetical protein